MFTSEFAPAAGSTSSTSSSSWWKDTLDAGLAALTQIKALEFQKDLLKAGANQNALLNTPGLFANTNAGQPGVMANGNRDLLIAGGLIVAGLAAVVVLNKAL